MALRRRADPRLRRSLVPLFLVALIGTQVGAADDADRAAPACALKAISVDAGTQRYADPIEDLEPCHGTIHPGARIITPHTECTAGFVFFADDGPNRTWYLGTAGHCFGDVVDCEDGSADVTEIEHVGRIGVKVFCTSRGLGSDFALVQIDEEAEGLVNPAICGWGGPDAVATESTGVVHHYGYGIGYGKSHATRMRTGYETAMDATSFRFIGVVDSGDSGSPVRLDSGAALGIATHANFDAFGLFAHSAPYAYGTTVPRAIALAHAGAGLEIQLATAPLP